MSSGLSPEMSDESIEISLRSAVSFHPWMRRNGASEGRDMRVIVVVLAAALAALVAGSAGAQAPKKDTLSVDLPGDAATLDPHVQWDTDSYTIYRNIFDNLLTRDAGGKIVPQIATA